MSKDYDIKEIQMLSNIGKTKGITNSKYDRNAMFLFKSL